MKKIATFLFASFITAYIYGQTTVDYIIKARACIEAGNALKANDLLTKALDSGPDSRLYSERGGARIISGDLSGAESDFNAANNLSPNSGEYGLAVIYSLRGLASTSVYHLERNLNSQFRLSEKQILLDKAFRRIENTPEWRQFWKKDWYSREELSLSEIEYYISTGKIDEAKSILNRIKSDFPESKEIAYGKALVALAAGKNTDAGKIADDLTRANPDSEKYLRLLAKIQEETSNPSGASSTLTRLIEKGVADAQLYLQRAGCYRKTGEFAKALADVEKYLGFYPENMEAISLSGKLEAASGDNLKAIEFFSKNIKLHPDDAQCYIDRANSYFIAKSWKWAADDYGMSLDLNPDNADAWLNKGISLLNSGFTETACHDFRRSLSLGNKKATEYISRNCIK